MKKVFENGTLKNTVFSPSDDFETDKLASNGATKNTAYYSVNNELVAKKNPDGTKNYYHNDHLGSTSVITNQSGNLVESTTYDPWGEVKTGGTKNKFLYTGQEHDSETKLHYYNARYYDPHIRRFTQPDDYIQDIYDPQMLNRYSYVRNNPLRYTDPTGNVKLLADFLKNPIGTIQGIVKTIAVTITTGRNIIQSGINVGAKIVTEVAKRGGTTPKNSPSYTPPSAQIQQVTQTGTKLGSNANVSRPGGINISPEKMTHVFNRHVIGGSQNFNASTFLNSKEIPTLIRNAEKTQPILQANGNLRRIVDADRIIGIDRATGKPTSTYTVITDMTNNLITTHPGVPTK